jgi:hypothetical protein
MIGGTPFTHARAFCSTKNNTVFATSNFCFCRFGISFMTILHVIFPNKEKLSSLHKMLFKSEFTGVQGPRSCTVGYALVFTNCLQVFIFDFFLVYTD